MLAAMQNNFTHVPSPPTNDLQPSSTAVSTQNYPATGLPSMIPVAMVPPPLLIGTGGANYTILPTGSTDGAFNHLQLSGGVAVSKTATQSVFYANQGPQLLTSPASPNNSNGYIPLVSTPKADPQTINENPHSDISNSQSSPVELKQAQFIISPAPVASSSVNTLLDRGTSSSDPQLSEHHHHGHCERVESLGRHRRKKHSKRRRHHEKHHHNMSDDPNSEGSDHLPPTKIIKEESDQTSSCLHKLPPQTTSSPTRPQTSYVQALVDIPMNAPLTRSSRTSSLSSSLSSFRFGGSLSQLWPLTTRMPNMKSTGNLNAETATMPSLGNQYFAFGGSLPELSLTSLSRLLPSSGASDSNGTSCPGLYTLPLYVYPSQQHLTTPFINANGSITFGSFLSGGSSLCSTQKAPPNLSEGGVESSESSSNPPSASIITGTENKVMEGGYSKLSGSSTSLASNSSAKIPMFTPVPGSLLGHPVTALPAFHTISNAADSAISHSNGVPSPIHSTTPQMASNSPPSMVAAPNLDTLACVATTDHHQLTRPVSPHTLPQHHMLHTTTGGAPHDRIQPHPHTDSKEGILGMPAHFVTRPGVIQSSSSVPIPGIKLEREAIVAPSPVKLSQESPHPIPVISMPISECLTAGEPHPHSVTSLQKHHPPTTTVEVLPKRERDKPYKCDHPGCDRSFSFPAHLRSHVQQIHISYRPCKCDFPGCGKRFYTPQHLNVHKRVHTGERPFVCPYADCGKAFTTAGNLKNHIRTHTGERPYSCKFEGCTKCFAEMSSLKKHELTHTGEKPYKCRVCGKAFSQAGSRNTHERKHNRTDDGEGEAGSKGPRRFRIKRITSSSDTTLIKPEPML